MGEGTLKEEIQHHVKKIINKNQNFVSFVGWKEGSELVYEYVKSDIVIAPGRCALEAMSCGKPVIAIGSKGYVGLIDKENWLKGVYANFGGIGNKIDDYIEGSIENDIKRIIESEQLRKNLEELGPNLIHLYFKEEEANENLLKFYSIYRRNSSEQNKTSEETAEMTSTYLLKLNIQKPIVTQLSTKSYQVEIPVKDADNVKFAWYIFKENRVIRKIPYSDSNSITYEFNMDGDYRIRCYVKKGNTTLAFPTKLIHIQS